MSEALVVLCMVPNQEVAGELSRGLVEQHLAACVNIIPGLRSIYRWQDAIEDDSELLLVIKTTHAHYAGVETWLLEHHPYEVPEVIALDISKGSNAYLAWLTQSTEKT